MRTVPPWHHRNRDLEKQKRQTWFKEYCPEYRPAAEHRYWELSHEYVDASIRSGDRYLKAMRLLPRRRGRQVGERHAGDLTEMDKLQLLRAYQCEDAILAKLKSFRLSSNDKKAVTKFAAAYAGVSVQQMEQTRPNRARTIGYRSHIL